MNRVQPSEVESGLKYMVQETEGGEWYECEAERDIEIDEPMLVHWIRTESGGNDVKIFWPSVVHAIEWEE